MTRTRDLGENSARRRLDDGVRAADRRWDPRSSKFVGYGHLVAACAKAGCPVCHCLRERTLQHLVALLAEHVTDPTTRARLVHSWGFCAAHAELLREVPDAPLGVGIIYHDLLGQTRRWLTQAQRGLEASPVRRRWRRIFRPRRPMGDAVSWRRARCPVCTAVADAERSYIDTLLTFIEDPELGKAYEASAGLCLPHVALALAQAPGHPGAVPLLARTLPKIDRLADELRRFIDKHDHRTPASFSDREAEAWTNALGFIAGRSEVFGNDVPRSPAFRDCR